MVQPDNDRIQKKILLRAARERVWRALTDADEFGTWFGMKLDGSFTPGATTRGTITPTEIDEEVAQYQKEYDGHPVEMAIERIEPQRLFSFRWHPYAIQKGVDYSNEPMTLVEFELEERPDGIMLTVTESGFDRIPLERRAQAFAANEGGWGMVIKLIEKYVAKA